MSKHPLKAPVGYLRKDSAAEKLRIAPRTLDGWMKRGLVPYVRIGRLIYFKESALDEVFTASGGELQKQLLETDRLRDIIRRASAEFFREGRSDGQTAAAMLAILSECRRQ